jgi:hypothetical protein
MIDSSYERRVRRAIAVAFVLSFCAALPPVLALLPPVAALRPSGEAIGVWVQRSGAVMTMLAAVAQFQAAAVATMIAGSTFAESWECYFKYKNYQRAANVLSLVLVVFGTLVWGYGDMVIAAVFGEGGP